MSAVGEHWGHGDVYGRILAALGKAGKRLDALTVEDLGPVDHLHARGFPATVELADRLPVRAGDLLLDIGCGVGGPARYLARRFGCRVQGIDITPQFVEVARKLTALVHMEGEVEFREGDAQRLPYGDAGFDGAYAQHVTMNVPDRPAFFAEAHRVLKPGAFFALTEHGLGPRGAPYYPLPWSKDGSGAYLATPEETRRLLEAAGFEAIEVEDTGAKYAAGYRAALDRAAQGTLPPLGSHVILGEGAMERLSNAARNIEEGRTHPIQVVCRKRR